ncbi:AI-2E family transporter [Paenibacillus caseinilyticus]|uniref:AI-2E family transporter n=1 Tax=Paenibacillus mucilaginosus TaxID=61624 RepID=UPI001EE650E1|nr:AI-2E family transporter [Paenibacillus mucilaginosus]
MVRLPQSRFFRISLGVILILIILNLFIRVSFLFSPLYAIARTILIPFIISGFCYYLLRPLVHLLESRGIRRPSATLVLYIFLADVAALLVVGLGPMLQSQTSLFVQNIPELLEGLTAQMEKMERTRWLSGYFTSDSLNLSAKLSEWISTTMNVATDYLTNALGVMTSTLLIITAIPIILYYLLSDGPKAMDAFLELFPERYQPPVRDMLDDMDKVLSEFMIGRILVCIVVGAMLYIGFLIISLPYPLLLATFAMIMNFIPFIGPLIGLVPCLMIAFTESSGMALWVLLIFIIAKMADNSLVSPQVFGKRMDLHPLTVVILLLVSAETAGIFGMLLSIPVYMVLKIIWLRFKPTLHV